MTPSEKLIIDELVRENIISTSDIPHDERNQRDGNGRFISRLEGFVKRGILKREQILSSIDGKIQLLSLSELLPAKDVINKVSYKYANFYHILPLRYEDSSLICAMSNPFDLDLRQEIETVLGISISPEWAFNDDIMEAQKKYYGLGANVGNRSNDSVKHRTESSLEIDDSASRLIDEILLDARKKRATDIHIEPHEKTLRLRYRIDGMLYDQKLMVVHYNNHDSMIARIKVMANLNLAEKRKPQDGRIKTTIGGNEFDLRISILPTEFGETVDIRLLNNEQINKPLSELGLSQSEIPLIEKALANQNGIILVTGPTGSGKTTTLYSFLRTLNTPERKIITIEDPIEYQLENITQLQVHPQINFTFANGLRSMLRHDPDIMMVGEIRDSETAKIAIQVALTGHLVLSTVHTNDAVATLSRLMDMAVEKYLLTATLECIIAQRLVRKICPNCMEPVEIKIREAAFQAYEGKGCSFCGNTGYYGRIGVFEILRIDRQIKDMIINGSSDNAIREHAVGKGMKTLFESGLEKVHEGITTYSEVLRITQAMD